MNDIFKREKKKNQNIASINCNAVSSSQKQSYKRHFRRRFSRTSQKGDRNGQ
jgi:hypothetical protein